MHSSPPPPSKPSAPYLDPPSPSPSPSRSSLSPVHSSHGHVSPPPPQVNSYSPSYPVVSPPLEALTNNNMFKAEEGEFARQVEQVGVTVDGISGGGRTLRPEVSTIRRVKREKMKRKALFWFRISAFVSCLVSFSVMAADKNQGWASESFSHYQELRYCMTVNIIGFVYSGLQLCNLANVLSTVEHTVKAKFLYYIDFSLDQMLTYLLLSASSSATFRVEDWELNWGKDKFPAMARASVVLSFLAFVAFALCSLVSGHSVFTCKSS